jgi:hypothetical protein
VSRCGRCDWRSEPELAETGREQLAGHADRSGHAICRCCERSLTVEETRTCEPCLTESRSLLAGIVVLWEQLDHHLGRIRGQALTGAPGGSEERALPGGDALVLAGPGSGGQAGRRLTAGELRDGLVQNLDGREHAADNRPSDPVSVAQVLTSWEDDWRHTFRQPASPLAASSTTRVVHAAQHYLQVHGRRAAGEHEDFKAYFTELQDLHRALERATGNDQRRVTADAECFGCGAGQLVREVRDGRPCHHDTSTLPVFPGEIELDEEGQPVLDASGRRVRVPIGERRSRYEAALEIWEAAHSRCQEQGGYADVWTCQRPGCGESYDWTRYLLAVRAKVRGTPAGDWSLPAHVALVLDVPVQTVLTWAKRGLIRTACLLGDRRMRVNSDDVRRRLQLRTKQAS